ncbi:MAG: general secretion pathway protein L [Phenylobacterium sp.]
MSEVLIIRLGSVAGDIIPWLVWSDAEQEIIASGEVEGTAQLSLLTEKADHREVCVLVPSCDVTLKTVPLPGKYNRQVVAALPFMLEDDVAEDVEKLFFATGDKSTVDGKVAVDVAIVATALMDNWLRWLDEAGLETKVLLPDALCLPRHGDDDETQVSGIQFEFSHQWLVRSDRWQCDSIDPNWFDDYLALIASQVNGRTATDAPDKEDSAEENARSPLLFNNYSPYDVDIEGLEVTPRSAELPLKLLVQNRPSNGFNLLQGVYARKNESSKSWGIWRQAAIVAGVALLLQLTFRGTVAWQLGSQLDTEKAAFVDQYKKAFPGERRVREALVERQLKNKLKAVQGSESGGSGFLEMLSEVGKVFSQTEGFVPNSIKFDSKRSELRLQATGDGFQSFEKFKSAVEGLGYQVQQGSLNNDGDKVVGAITIKRVG